MPSENDARGKQIIEKWTPTWSSLNQLGQNRILRSSYIWLFITPIAARIFKSIPQSIDVPFMGNIITLALDLPFNWTLLFYTALAVSMANALYSLRCPTIIQAFPDYSSFKSTGRGLRQLVHERIQLGNTDEVRLYGETIPVFNEAIDQIHATLTGDIYGYGRNAGLNAPEVPDYDDEMMARAFWVVRDYADLRFLYSRLFTGLCYGLGFLFITIIAVQNILFVVRQSL